MSFIYEPKPVIFGGESENEMNSRKAKISTILIAVFIFSSIFSLQTAQSQMGNFLLVVDPGHGGVDPGAISQSGLKEKTINLKIARLISTISYLDFPDIKVNLTRRKDKYLHPYSRTQFANERNADLFLSVHADSFGDPSVKGIAAFTAQESSEENRKIAQIIMKILAQKTGRENRGVKQAPLFIRKAEMPAILIEVGFISNSEDAQKLNTLSYQRDIAEGILRGVQAYIHNQS